MRCSSASADSLLPAGAPAELVGSACRSLKFKGASAGKLCPANGLSGPVGLIGDVGSIPKPVGAPPGATGRGVATCGAVASNFARQPGVSAGDGVTGEGFGMFVAG